MIALFLFVFAIVLFATVFNLMLFGWIASRFLPEREAKIAVFAFLLGGVILGGQILGTKLEWPVGTDEIALLFGCLVGIAFVWFQFFRKDASMADLTAIARQMIAHYNAQDADSYVSLMTEDACEANYRGAVVREGREGTREGLKAAFARWPQNRAEIKEAQAIGNYVLMREHVTRGPATDGSPPVEPFDVIAIYSFEGEKCSRVEFVR